jgi:hypothetical protein
MEDESLFPWIKRLEHEADSILERLFKEDWNIFFITSIF